MKRLLLAASFAFLLLSSTAALADKKHGKHHGDHHGHDDDDRGHRRHDNGKHKGWRKGERIDTVYLERRYYVEDYHHYHLTPPPRGHRWVRTDEGRFILVAVATGIIADILLHH